MTYPTYLATAGNSAAEDLVREQKASLLDPVGSNLLVVGEETVSRTLLNANATIATGTMRFTYFTCRKTESTTQAKIYTGSTAAGATPTLVRVGLYTVDSSGNLTLVASTPTDTTLFAAANTAYSKSWSTAYIKLVGQRLALGILVVTGAATPTFPATTGTAANVINTAAPALSSSLTAQADLPATVTVGSLSTGVGLIYSEILP